MGVQKIFSKIQGYAEMPWALSTVRFCLALFSKLNKLRQKIIREVQISSFGFLKAVGTRKEHTVSFQQPIDSFQQRVDMSALFWSFTCETGRKTLEKEKRNPNQTGFQLSQHGLKQANSCCLLFHNLLRFERSPKEIPAL